MNVEPEMEFRPEVEFRQEMEIPAETCQEVWVFGKHQQHSIKLPLASTQLKLGRPTPSYKKVCGGVSHTIYGSSLCDIVVTSISSYGSSKNDIFILFARWQYCYSVLTASFRFNSKRRGIGVDSKFQRAYVTLTFELSVRK